MEFREVEYFLFLFKVIPSAFRIIKHVLMMAVLIRRYQLQYPVIKSVENLLTYGKHSVFS